VYFVRIEKIEQPRRIKEPRKKKKNNSKIRILIIEKQN